MKKIGAILLSICMLNLTFGCTSIEEISIQKASWESRNTKRLLIHDLYNIYELHNYKFNDLTLEGQLERFEHNYQKSINIYTNISVIPDSANHVVIDYNDIKEITQISLKVPTKPLIYIGLVWGAIALGVFIYYASQVTPLSFPDM